MQQLLQQHFGFSQFRPGQEAVISRIVNGQNAAAIFPTGSGKSLCYQLPALVLPHLTLVVSPLLALMQDQLEFLNQHHIPSASIDSSQTREQSNEIMQAVRSGQIKILMISVERLNNERFRQFIKGIAISLLVVDEAHCISEWGHNFRPDYLKLPHYQKALSIPQTLLLTATATQAVIKDMGEKFNIPQENIELTGFYRPNLHLKVKGISSQHKSAFLVDWLARRRAKQGFESGIIYVTLQQTAELVAKELQSNQIPAQAYHAGMSSEVRQQIQKNFMEGEQGIIVATIAFGMGIDKSDIRFVVHYDLPKSIENYAQEIGRAGRDGQVSDCLVLANADNINILENFVYGDTPEIGAIEFILSEISTTLSRGETQWELMLNRLSSQSNIRALSLKTLLVYLEIEKAIKPLYSYFAEYRFKLSASETEIKSQFNAQRQAFIQAIFDSADKARVWYSADFNRLEQHYPQSRERAIRALEYLQEQGLIELQSQQMTQVYQLSASHFNYEQLRQNLYRRFSEKESAEVARINQLLTIFTQDQCLTWQLSQYFSDTQLQGRCGHCSVCLGELAVMPPLKALKPLQSYDLDLMSQEIKAKLPKAPTAVVLTRYFCGLTTPIFTQYKLRSTRYFASLEQYRFADVHAWVKQDYDQ